MVRSPPRQPTRVPTCSARWRRFVTSADVRFMISFVRSPSRHGRTTSVTYRGVPVVHFLLLLLLLSSLFYRFTGLRGARIIACGRRRSFGTEAATGGGTRATLKSGVPFVCSKCDLLSGFFVNDADFDGRPVRSDRELATFAPTDPATIHFGGLN